MDTNIINELKYNNNKLLISLDDLKYSNSKLSNKLQDLELKYNSIQHNYILLIDILKKHN